MSAHRYSNDCGDLIRHIFFSLLFADTSTTAVGCVVDHLFDVVAACRVVTVLAGARIDLEIVTVYERSGSPSGGSVRPVESDAAARDGAASGWRRNATRTWNVNGKRSVNGRRNGSVRW